MTEEAFFEQYMKHFSAQQRAAVEAVEGPVLLLAVPGGGKTTVLVTRLGFMIKCCGIRPEEILTLTYTVAATRDMAARYREIFGSPDNSSAAMEAGDAACRPFRDGGTDYAARESIPEFRTINGICAKVILYYGRRIGKPPFSLAQDEKKLSAALSGIYQKLEGEYAGESELSEVRRMITYIKNMMLTPDEIRKLSGDSGLQLEEMYTMYNQYLRSQRLMDYDDQLVYALAILKNSPETRMHFQKAYRHICVDEAQDTSKIQHEIIKLLAREHENLFMVGDEDQSIYGFRAAYPDALLAFEADHPGAKVLLMEDNFRSNAAIVDAAGRFIGSNHLRHAKSMRASRPAGAQIRIVALKGRSAQFTYLAKALADLSEETAVLYRDNESMIPLADILERRGIPFRTRSADPTFFSSRVVSDITSIMEFAYDPSNTDIFRRIYYKIPTYLTKAQMERICLENAGGTRSLLSAALAGRDVPPHVRNQLRFLQSQFNRLLTDSAGEALKRISGEMGYRDYLERTGISDRKLKVLSILSWRESDVPSFLHRLKELEETLSGRKTDPSCPLILSTIHSSKGLEYNSVYLIDAIDGIFPDQKPEPALLSRWHRRRPLADSEMQEIRAWEEERRLFYVGVTRAKNALTIFRAGENAALVDDFRQCLIKPPEKKTSRAGAAEGQRRTGEDYIYIPPDPRPRASAAIPIPGKKRSPGSCGTDIITDMEGYLEFCRELGEGVIVEHKTFGEGVITSMDDATVTILFGDQVKKLGLPLIYQKALLWIV